MLISRSSYLIQSAGTLSRRNFATTPGLCYDDTRHNNAAKLVAAIDQTLREIKPSESLRAYKKRGVLPSGDTNSIRVANLAHMQSTLAHITNQEETSTVADSNTSNTDPAPPSQINTREVPPHLDSEAPMSAEMAKPRQKGDDSLSKLFNQFNSPTSPFYIPPGGKGPASPNEIPSPSSVPMRPNPSGNFKARLTKDSVAWKQSMVLLTQTMKRDGFDKNILWKVVLNWGDVGLHKKLPESSLLNFLESGRMRWLMYFLEQNDKNEIAAVLKEGRGFGLRSTSMNITFETKVTYPDQLWILYKPESIDPSGNMRMSSVTYSRSQGKAVMRSTEEVEWFDCEAYDTWTPSEDLVQLIRTQLWKTRADDS